MKLLAFISVAIAVLACGSPPATAIPESGVTLQISGSRDQPAHIFVPEGLRQTTSFNFPVKSPSGPQARLEMIRQVQFELEERERHVVASPKLLRWFHPFDEPEPDTIKGTEFMVVPGKVTVFEEFSQSGIPTITFRVVPRYPAVPVPARVTSEIESVDVLKIVKEGWNQIEVELRNNRDVDILRIGMKFGSQGGGTRWGTETRPIAQGEVVWVESFSVARRYLQTDDGGFEIDPGWFPEIEIDFVEFVDGITEGEIHTDEPATSGGGYSTLDFHENTGWLRRDRSYRHVFDDLRC